MNKFKENMEFTFFPDWAETEYEFKIMSVDNGTALVSYSSADPITDEIWQETHTCQILTDSTSEYVKIKDFCLRAEDADEDGYDSRRYSSATARDYGPGNPWDAPGMSIRDFI